MANIRPLNEDLKKIAKEQLHEIEERIPQDIEELRNWIIKQPHLQARTDDQFLVSFLRGCKYNLEKAKSKIDYFYTIKAMLPELFDFRVMDERTQDLCRSGTCVHLPQSLGAGGPRIHLTNLSILDDKKYSMKDYHYYQCLLMEVQINADDNSIISGLIEVYDLSKINFSLLAQLDFSLVKKLISFAEKAAPIRLKGVHVINCPKEAQVLLTLVRSLMSKKLKKRFHVHKSLNDFYKIIPKQYLPIEYGGTSGYIADIQSDMEQQLLKYENYFLDEKNYGVNEKLRPGKQVNTDLHLNIEGSFRKLDID